MLTQSTLQQQPPANADARCDYLRTSLAWVPSKRFGHGRVYEYRLELGGDDVAILRLVADKGWALTIAHGPGRAETARGLFGKPHDALTVLVAELVAADLVDP